MTLATYPDTAIEIYTFIIEYKCQHDGNSPSIREICRAMDIRSTATAHAYVQEMIESGLAERIDGKLCMDGGKWIYIGETDE